MVSYLAFQENILLTINQSSLWMPKVDIFTKTLFSSKLFSSYCLLEEYSADKTAKIERIILYHRLNFSSIEKCCKSYSN
jgi:hypothetical protein